MAQQDVELVVPFSALVRSISRLSREDKHRLWELLRQEMAEGEDEAWESDAGVQAEVAEARAAYEAGDYVTIEEYAAQRRGQS